MSVKSVLEPDNVAARGEVEAAGESAAARPRYERPRILGREMLEGIAAVCTPVGKGSVAQCPSGPIAS